MNARVKVSPLRFTGSVIEMKGKFGWIQSDMPISHPDYAKRKGRIYLSVSDVEVGGAPSVGDKVSFLVYTDGSGLGAMSCKPADGAGVQKTIGKPQTLGPGAAASAVGKRESLGDDHLYTGKIQQWNGSHGWITPLDNITHPRYNGRIYLKNSDVDSKEPLMVGKLVTFFLYTDTQGLGAEHCTVADADSTPLSEEPAPATVLKAKPKGGFPSSPIAPSSPSPSPGDAADSVVLKAKPKMAAAPPPESSVLKAKPKMSAAGATIGMAGKPATVTIPAHLSETLAQRLVAWMWDRGG
uniref:Uncharacterized protein n=1 Tax=Alexandrium catenella TaxID=2925 RepID=A0A7S1SHN4_ALECA